MKIKNSKKSIETNTSATSNWKFINATPSCTLPKTQICSNSRLLRKTTITQNKSVPVTGEITILDKKSNNTIESILENQFNNDELQTLQNAFTLNKKNSNNEINTAPKDDEKFINESGNNFKKSKIQTQSKERSTFDAIEFGEDQTQFFFSDEEIDNFDNDIHTSNKEINDKDSNILNEEKSNSNILKGIIREEILTKAKNNKPSFNNISTFAPSKIITDKQFGDTSSISKRKKHILNVFELMGNNDIPLEEKHKKLPKGHNLEEEENIDETKIFKQMNSCLEEQGIEPLDFLKTSLPQARPPSREIRKSIYD